MKKHINAKTPGLRFQQLFLTYLQRVLTVITTNRRLPGRNYSTKRGLLFSLQIWDMGKKMRVNIIPSFCSNKQKCFCLAFNVLMICSHLLTHRNSHFFFQHRLHFNQVSSESTNKPYSCFLYAFIHLPKMPFSPPWRMGSRSASCSCIFPLRFNAS